MILEKNEVIVTKTFTMIQIPQISGIPLFSKIKKKWHVPPKPDLQVRKE